MATALRSSTLPKCVNVPKRELVVMGSASTSLTVGWVGVVGTTRTSIFGFDGLERVEAGDRIAELN